MQPAKFYQLYQVTFVALGSYWESFATDIAKETALILLVLLKCGKHTANHDSMLERETGFLPKYLGGDAKAIAETRFLY